jgi:hypothetical protein
MKRTSLLLVYVVVLTYTDAATAGILPGGMKTPTAKERHWEG